MSTSGVDHDWFKRSLANHRHGGEFWLSIGRRWCCPCCGYPTLLERDAYEICELCWWEDDGQNEDRAHEVWGGPNHDYSLADGQENFNRYWSIYDPADDPRSWHDSRLIVHLKTALAQIFDSLCEEISESVARQLCAVVLTLEAALQCELERLTANVLTEGWLKGSAQGLHPKTI